MPLMFTNADESSAGLVSCTARSHSSRCRVVVVGAQDATRAPQRAVRLQIELRRHGARRVGRERERPADDGAGRQIEVVVRRQLRSRVDKVAGGAVPPAVVEGARRRADVEERRAPGGLGSLRARRRARSRRPRSGSRPRRCLRARGRTIGARARVEVAAHVAVRVGGRPLGQVDLVRVELTQPRHPPPVVAAAHRARARTCARRPDATALPSRDVVRVAGSARLPERRHDPSGSSWL